MYESDSLVFRIANKIYLDVHVEYISTSSPFKEGDIKINKSWKADVEKKMKKL